MSTSNEQEILALVKALAKNQKQLAAPTFAEKFKEWGLIIGVVTSLGGLVFYLATDHALLEETRREQLSRTQNVKRVTEMSTDMEHLKEDIAEIRTDLKLLLRTQTPR